MTGVYGPIADLRTQIEGTNWITSSKWKPGGGTIHFKNGRYNEHWSYETPAANKVTVIWSGDSKVTWTLGKDGKTLLEDGKVRFELMQQVGK